METLKGEHENDNEQMKKASVSAQEGGIGSLKVHESLSVPSGGLTIQKQVLNSSLLYLMFVLKFQFMHMYKL